MPRKSPDHRTNPRRLKARRGVRRGPSADAKKPLGLKSSREKVRAFRARMRAKGFRLVQLWLPDLRTAEFAAQARRQSRLANTSSFASADQAWVDSMTYWKID